MDPSSTDQYYVSTSIITDDRTTTHYTDADIQMSKRLFEWVIANPPGATEFVADYHRRYRAACSDQLSIWQFDAAAKYVYNLIHPEANLVPIAVTHAKKIDIYAYVRARVFFTISLLSRAASSIILDDRRPNPPPLIMNVVIFACAAGDILINTLSGIFSIYMLPNLNGQRFIYCRK